MRLETTESSYGVRPVGPVGHFDFAREWFVSVAVVESEILRVLSPAALFLNFRAGER